MTTIYHIDITNGTFKIDHATAPRAADAYHAPNAKQYFAASGKAKPTPIPVRGWRFKKMYLTHGTDENGQAVAWS